MLIKRVFFRFLHLHLHDSFLFEKRLKLMHFDFTRYPLDAERLLDLYRAMLKVEVNRGEDVDPAQAGKNIKVVLRHGAGGDRLWCDPGHEQR